MIVSVFFVLFCLEVNNSLILFPHNHSGQGKVNHIDFRVGFRGLMVKKRGGGLGAGEKRDEIAVQARILLPHARMHLEARRQNSTAWTARS